MRDEFSKAVKDTLAKRVGFKCSNPDCRVNTVGPNNDTNKATSIGIAAHITAASLYGPRYDKNISSEERKSIENGIWLCSNCSALIDKDPKEYPTDKLKEWKVISEFLTKRSLDSRGQLDSDEFHSRFMDLVGVLENTLQSVTIEIKKTQGGKIIERNVYSAKNAFPWFWKRLRVTINRNGVDKEQVIRQHFEAPLNGMDNYFNQILVILKYIRRYEKLVNVEIYQELLTSQLTYYEKLLIFYWKTTIRDEKKQSILNDVEIFDNLKNEDKLIKGFLIKN